MRQHKILTWALLILSIINFALAAPVAVRGRPEVRLDANVSGKVTAASQKRQDSLEEMGSTSANVPGPDIPLYMGGAEIVAAFPLVDSMSGSAS